MRSPNPAGSKFSSAPSIPSQRHPRNNSLPLTTCCSNQFSTNNSPQLSITGQDAKYSHNVAPIAFHFGVTPQCNMLRVLVRTATISPKLIVNICTCKPQRSKVMVHYERTAQQNEISRHNFEPASFFFHYGNETKCFILSQETA